MVASVPRKYRRHAVVRAVTRRLPTAAAPGFKPRSDHVAPVLEKRGTGAGFLQVLPFPQPVIPPTAPISSPSGVGATGHLVASVAVDSVPLHTTELAKLWQRFVLWFK
jgi:hypothetical protein